METVTQNQDLTQDELQILKNLQNETQSIILELGEIELTKIQLEKRHESAKTFLVGLELKEQEFTKNIFEKYGKVSIDHSTGEITSIS